MSETDERASPPRITAPRIELLCPGCRKLHEFPAESRGEEVTCPECGETFQAARNVPVLYVPWEDRSRIGLARAVYRTVWTSLLAPKAFFKRMPIDGGWFAPLTYGALICALSVVGSSLWGFLVAIPNQFPEAELTFGLYVRATFVMALPMLAMALGFYMGFLHMSVLLFKGSAPYMQSTARVVAYSSGALLFMLIPYVGPVLTVLWFFYLCAVGLREAQEFSTVKAVFAALSPVLLLLLLMSGKCQLPTQGPGATSAP